MRGSSAVDEIMGDIFGYHRRQKEAAAGQAFLNQRRRGRSARRPSVSRMSRVNAPHGKAIFKLVRAGGAKDKSGLRGQLKYIFNEEKVGFVIDPSGAVQPHENLDDRNMKALIQNWSQDWWSGTRNGQTSHMILSFPHTATMDQVEGTTRDVLDDLLNGPDRQFRYIAAMHTDREHPHVHVVVNRRASDNSLFTLRSGTELSYESFREAMAEHGEKYGLRLDPTFRFERGITDRQPSFSEQRLAQKEGRAPRQRPRTGTDLDYQKELISQAKIAYNAMAVLAANADVDRLARAYENLGQILGTDKEHPPMAELSERELEKFDRLTELVSDGINQAREMLERKDPADRVDAEVQLEALMRDFTQLSRDADYAKDLHAEPQSNTIYMHNATDNIRSDGAQAIFAQAEKDYGLTAEVMTSRIEAGAFSNRLEQEWARDDLKAISETQGLDLGNAEQREQALEKLNAAYAELREGLVAENAINHLPHLDPDYRADLIDNRQNYEYQSDRFDVDLRDVMDHYRQQGAPEEWVRENVGLLKENLEDLYAEREQLHRDSLDQSVDRQATRQADSTLDFEAKFDLSTEEGRNAYVDAVHSDLTERGVMEDESRTKTENIGQDLVDRNPTMPLHMVDRIVDSRLAAFEVVEAQRAYEPEAHTALSPFIEKVEQGRAVAPDEAERSKLFEAVRLVTNDAEFERIQNGNFDRLAELVGDERTAMEIGIEVSDHAREAGAELDREVEERIAAHREQLERDERER